MDSEIKTYRLVASFTEARTYYLFTPDGQELVLLSRFDSRQIHTELISSEANNVELEVANHLFRLNQIVQ